MKNRRVFVSGGAGVIGRELVARLAARGAIVLVGDLKPRPAEFSPEVLYRQGDLNTISPGELEAFAPEVFFHLAATFERSVESRGFWGENFWHNVRLSHHLMGIARDLSSLRRVVFASSYLIYEPSLYQFENPSSQAVSLKEDMPLMPRNLTGMAKLAHEIELRFLGSFKDNRFSAVCARIYRGYGRGSRDVISRWIRELILGNPITVFRPEGIFDYIYAGDSAEGLIRLADADGAHGVVNLGTGRGRSVSDVLTILSHHFPSMRVKIVDSEIPFEASQADMGLFRSAVAWVPEYTLETAIPEIIAFERARGPGANQRPIGKVLVTSASKKIPLVRAMQEAARRLHPDTLVVAGDTSSDALTRYVADEFWHMPSTHESQLDALISGCKERGIGVVLPTRDGELAFWSRYAERFSREGIWVVISSAEAVDLCLDKFAFAEFGKQHGLPVIPTGLNIDDLAGGPYVVKERFGAGSRQLGLNLSRAEASVHASELSAPIYQPFISGEEFSIDAWCDNGHRVKGLVVRRRDRVVDGESQVTTTIRNAVVELHATRMLEALKLRGPVVLQILVDSSGDLQVIECNARFGGASTTSISVGLDLLFWSLLESTGADLSSVCFTRLPGEVRLVRVPQDVVSHGSHF